jgi:hypothetical protein
MTQSALQTQDPGLPVCNALGMDVDRRADKKSHVESPELAKTTEQRGVSTDLQIDWQRFPILLPSASPAPLREISSARIGSACPKTTLRLSFRPIFPDQTEQAPLARPARRCWEERCPSRGNTEVIRRSER